LADKQLDLAIPSSICLASRSHVDRERGMFPGVLHPRDGNSQRYLKTWNQESSVRRIPTGAATDLVVADTGLVFVGADAVVVGPDEVVVYCPEVVLFR
jgi:predicted ATP-grasp superfamily ATP-dependent carboligase